MALAGIGVLAHVEPAGALRLSTRTAANGAAVITSATCFPAIHRKAHQQRELAMHGGAERERVAQKL